MLYTSKSDFVRQSDVNCETLYYKMMNFVLRNDESKILCRTLVNPVLYEKTLSVLVAKSKLKPWTTLFTAHIQTSKPIYNV